MPATENRVASTASGSSSQPKIPAVTADADKIKAEHMRSNSAVPALSSLHLNQKPSLLSRSHTVAGTDSAEAVAAADSMQPSLPTSGHGHGQKLLGASANDKNTPGVLNRAHTVAAMDPTKLPAAASRVAVTDATPHSSTAWKKQRPGATSFEKLQVSSYII